MNNPRFILTADDFGPIEFINNGVIDLVQKGLINSVHILSNFAQDKLISELKRLAEAVPEQALLDIGIHFTINSGKPLYGTSDGERMIPLHWQKFVENIGSETQPNWVFKGFKDFYQNFLLLPRNSTEYKTYEKAIKQEFKLQRQQLETAISDVNDQFENARLVLTSSSNHHNLVITAHELLNLYLEASEGLAVRAPKMIPQLTGWALEKVNALLMKCDSKKYRDIAKGLREHFNDNQFYRGEEDLNIKSPAYVDGRAYYALGSLTLVNIKEFKIRSRVRKFAKMIKYADKKYLMSVDDFRSPFSVEFVYHLGKRTVDNSQSYEQMVEHYTGVEPKYFDNRYMEYLALARVKTKSKYSDFFNSKLSSWTNTGITSYRKV